MLDLKHWRRRARFIPITLQNIITAERLARRYGHPERQMRLVGITGTDGKTTTANLLFSILKADGHKVGLISTLGAVINDQLVDTGLHVSTPGPAQIYSLLATMRDQGVTDVIIEVTSHALDQRRVHGLPFKVALVTNVTPEHLDYHGTFAAYVAAKARLLRQAEVSILNAQDDAVMSMVSQAKKVLTYATKRDDADIAAQSVATGANGSTFDLVADQAANWAAADRRMQVSLPGTYNVSNALAAIGGALQLNVPAASIKRGLLEVTGLDGRWEILQQQPFTVIVDFAHTPNALAEVLPVAASLRGPAGRLFHVFGSAADRDQSKRAEMGRLSGALADVTVLTMEDPRHESLDRIQNMILAGLKPTGKKEEQGWVRIDDRGLAIEWAINHAAPGDVVLITGKGHEKSLAIGDVEHPWSDQLEVQKALKKKPRP